LLARRTPSRPVFAGIEEFIVTPYVHLVSPLRPLAPALLSFDATAALQYGSRAYKPIRAGYTRGVLLDTATGLDRFTVYYTGSGGQRTVLAGFGRAAVHARLPMSWSPVISGLAHWAQGGGSPRVDRNFVPFVYDTNTYFGNAGYFGARNVRAAGTRLTVPLRNGWSARVAAWRADVDDAATGLYLENGALLDPEVFTAARRAAARSRNAVHEWDAEVRWAPGFLPLTLRAMYSEVRHGAYVAEMIRAGAPFSAPPAQFGAVHFTYLIE
jgi:hypothetical protein